MRLMVYEPVGTGHRFEYVAHLVLGLKSIGIVPILVTTPQARSSVQFNTHLASLSVAMEIDDWFEMPTRRVDIIFSLARYFERSLARTKPDHCWLPCADGISEVVGLKRSLGLRSAAQDHETEALHFTGNFGYGGDPIRRVKMFAAQTVIPRVPWSTYFHLDEHQLEAVSRGKPDFQSRCRVMPDPVKPVEGTTKEAARIELGIPVEGRYVGCAGGLNRRKGTDLLIQAFAEARPKLRSDDRLLLAGPISADIRATIEKDHSELVQSHQLVTIDRYVTSNEFDMAMAAMDVVATPYPFHAGSSGIVLRAAAIGRPLIAADVKWMGRTVREFDLGDTCHVQDRCAFADKIVDCLDRSAAFVTTEDARRLLRFNSVENFVATWSSRLCEKLQITNPVKPIPWEWVRAAGK